MKSVKIKHFAHKMLIYACTLLFLNAININAQLQCPPNQSGMTSFEDYLIEPVPFTFTYGSISYKTGVVSGKHTIILDESSYTPTGLGTYYTFEELKGFILTYLSNLNSQSNVNYERQLERGRGIVWGSWNKYCFPAGPLKGMVTSGNDPDIAVQRYQEKIDEAWKENQYHNQMVHNHPGFFQYGKRVWHRSRAGDWSAVRNAYHNIEKDYKLASSHDVNFGSDAFISGNSQRLHSTQFPPLHDPIYSSKDKREQIHGNEIPRVTHGEMVGQLLPNGGKSSAALKRILEKLSYD